MLWSPRLSLANFHVKLTAKGLFRNLQLLPGCRKNTMVFQSGLPSPFSHHSIHPFHSPSVGERSGWEPGIKLAIYLLNRRFLPFCLMGEGAFSSFLAHTYTHTPPPPQPFPPPWLPFCSSLACAVTVLTSVPPPFQGTFGMCACSVSARAAPVCSFVIASGSSEHVTHAAEIPINTGGMLSFYCQ